MIKADKTLKSIFIKTGKIFLVLYIIITITFVSVFFISDVKQKKGEFFSLNNVLEGEVTKAILQYKYDKLDENYKGNIKDENSLIADLNMKLSFYTSGYTKVFLYDKSGKMVAKSGAYAEIASCRKKDEKTGEYDYLDGGKYIDLEKFFSNDELNEIYSMFLMNSNNDEVYYNIRGDGYIDGGEVIPKKIFLEKITIDEHRIGGESKEVVKTYEFNNENVNTLEKVEFDEFLHLYLPYYDKVNANKYSNSNVIKRYDGMNANKINYKWGIGKKITPTKVSYGSKRQIYVNRETYNLVVYSDYYIWDDIILTVIIICALLLVIIAVLTFVLSKGLYKTYEKQIQLEKNRRELTSAIAHELKTPLGIIKSYGESIKENISESKKDYYLDVIIDETDKMDNLVLEMLDLSKLENNAYKLKNEIFCINELFSKILKKNEKFLKDKKIKINYKSDEIYKIDGDYFRIEQVIDNLLSNAMYHAKENININIENRIVSIENDGKHISEDKINLIWDMFYKEDKSRERSERRSGIGLAIVKNILELHNMEFGVLNTEFGVKFWFKI